MAKLTDLKGLLQKAHAEPSLRVRQRSHVAPDAPRLEQPSPDSRRIDPRDVRNHRSPAHHVEGDIDIARAFADVTRLPPPNRASPARERPRPIAQRRQDDERDALESSKYGAEPSPTAWDIGQEQEGEQTFVRRGLGSDVLVKLRRGHWAVQAVIDLHGMTSVEAHDALADFLLDARSRGLRCVRIIHGKGLTSPNREPVLKGKVRRWLAQWDDVLAYCEAARHAGGGGAVVALLRSR